MVVVVVGGLFVGASALALVGTWRLGIRLLPLANGGGGLKRGLCGGFAGAGSGVPLHLARVGAVTGWVGLFFGWGTWGWLVRIGWLGAIRRVCVRSEWAVGCWRWVVVLWGVSGPLAGGDGRRWLSFESGGGGGGERCRREGLGEGGSSTRVLQVGGQRLATRWRSTTYLDPIRHESGLVLRGGWGRRGVCFGVRMRTTRALRREWVGVSGVGGVTWRLPGATGPGLWGGFRRRAQRRCGGGIGTRWRC